MGSSSRTLTEYFLINEFIFKYTLRFIHNNIIISEKWVQDPL